MDLAAYRIEAEIEATHWWFVVRRRLFARLIRALDVPRDAPVLDIGTSTGTNLRLLRDLGFHDVRGLDVSPVAARFCAEKGLGAVTVGDAAALPFADAAFPLVPATDMIEHLDDDAAGLAEIRRVLTRGGTALVTVPAFQSLWGLQDDVSHHKRRYGRQELREKLAAAGLRVECLHYFNFLLFAPIWLARQVLRRRPGRVRSENEVNSPALNAILAAVFALDVRLAPVLRPPFGVSLLAVVTRD